MPEPRAQIAPLPPSAPGRPPQPQRDDEEIDLGELIGVLVEGRWLIAAAALIATLVGGVYAFSATPIYRADAMVQVEEKSASANPLKDLSAMFNGETPAEAEIEIIRSRSVVAQVVQQLHLDIEILPKRAPLIGGTFARRHDAETPASPKFWMSSYAWGGEKLELSKLEVPRGYDDVALTFVAEEGGFRLETSDGDLLLRGKIGELVTANGFEAQVATMVARPGTRFAVKKLAFIDAVTKFQEDLSVSEKGKNTGIIQLGLQGTDRERIRSALDALMDAYVRQNVERKAEEAQKTLEFVQGQLPVMKKNVDEAELKLKQYRSQAGKVDISIEAQALVDRAAEIEKQVTTLELQKSELLQRYTNAHPTVVALRNQLASLSREKRLLEAQARDLPETELNSVRLVRDVKVANELYVLLLTKAQELGVMKSGTIGNVRVVDAAVTQPRPVSPKKPLTVALSLLIGLAGGIGLTFVRKSLNRGVDDPEVLENALGMTVYASVPFSDQQSQMIKAAERNKEGLKALAVSDPADLAIESLRSLRTSLQFSLATSKNKVVMIGGSRPGVGKSFLSVNLAYVMADAGKKVLLIDADLRKGLLHRYFGGKREGGLSEVILGTPVDQLVRDSEKPNLKFLSSGAIPPNPSELLSSDRFAELIAQVQEHYDLVIVDAPPILAVTDAAVIGRIAGVNLMVVKSGLHPLREISTAVARMEQSGARPNGFVFNAVPLKTGLSGYGKYKYHYQYDYR